MSMTRLGVAGKRWRMLAMDVGEGKAFVLLDALVGGLAVALGAAGAVLECHRTTRLPHDSLTLRAAPGG